jgi:hypothetical protein
MTNQEIQKILIPIHEEHVKIAMENIEASGIPTGRGSQSYDVLNLETGKKYPPPYLIELAYTEATGLKLPNGFFDNIKRNGPHFKKIENLGFQIIEKKDPIDDLIERYKTYISKTKMQDEVYKWKLTQEFEGRPNTQEVDFKKEIHNIKFENLIYSMASGVLRHIAKTEPEALRKYFIHLFDESIDLDSRMVTFQNNVLTVYREMGETNPHHQDERSIATYLTFHKPIKYTFYKSSYYKPFCKLMRVEQAGKNKNYSHYLELLNVFIAKYIADDIALIDLVKSLIPEHYDGSNHLLLAQDILYTMLSKEDENESIENKTRYWLYAPGENAIMWDEFLLEGIMGLNWDNLGNLNNYSTKKDIATRLQALSDSDSSKSNDAKACYDFVHVIKEGDIVFVKKGNSALLGYGIVTGPAVFNEQRVDYKNIRNVDWKLKGEWDPEHTLVQKTLTDITDFPTQKIQFNHYYERLFASMGANLNHAISLNTDLIPSFVSAASIQNLYFDSFLTKRYIASLATKPFIIFTGLSGSGKTKLAQTFAKWISIDDSQYSIIPVGADWTNREPLIGYPNGLDSKKYVLPDNGALNLIFNAIENAKDKGLSACSPYFLILDEMNLSHVERYFADFLSAMESQEPISLYSGGDRLDENNRLIPKEILLPKNLFIIGTVNIDETTYMFSPKVLDRANTIEFRVDKNDLETFFDAENNISQEAIDGKGQLFTYEFMTLVSNETIINDTYHNDLLNFFEALQPVGAEFGYRTANEMNRLIYQLDVLGLERDEMSLDVAVMQKLLPKLHGSRTKLNKVLPVLASFCIKDKKLETAKTFLEEKYREGQLKQENINQLTLPLSFAKIARMYSSAQENGFASYAEG